MKIITIWNSIFLFEGQDDVETDLEDEEGPSNADDEKDESSNEFRDRVPSVGELQQQLEELMKALIDLQMSR